MDYTLATEKEIYNAFGVPQELLENPLSNKESAELQLNKFLELGKIKIKILTNREGTKIRILKLIT